MKLKLYWLLLLNISLAFKQSDEDPTMVNVLKSVSQVDIFQAIFIYTSQEADKQEEVQAPTQGEVWVKGEKYHILLNEQEVVCNGQIVWSYLPQDQEVQITEYDPEQETLDPIKLLTLYRSGFIPVSLKTTQLNKNKHDIMELIASEPEHWIRKIILTVNQKEKYIKRIKALDADGYWHSFEITHFEIHKDLPDSCFEFDVTKYPKTEIVDLR